MADPKSTLGAVARTHAFTVTLVTTRQDSLGAGKVTKVREGSTPTVKGSGTKQVPCAECSAEVKLLSCPPSHSPLLAALCMAESIKQAAGFICLQNQGLVYMVGAARG